MNEEKKQTSRYLLAAGLATASLAVGCGRSPQKQWANSPGTNGFINLDAVKEAFQKNPDIDKFETRVNEIFEGDNLIIFNSQEYNDGFVYTAKEDLDRNKEISNQDETLFILTVRGGRATLQGAGVNAYYKETWPYKLNEEEKRYAHSHHHSHYYWYWGRGWRGYYTSAPRYDRMRAHQSSFRQSDQFGSQVKQNADFENRMSKRYGEGFRKSVNTKTGLRNSYINRTMKSSGFKQSLTNNKSTSGWGKRAGMSTRSSFSSSRGSSGRSGGFGGHRGSSGFGV